MPSRQLRSLVQEERYERATCTARPLPRLHPNSGLPEFSISNWPKSDKSDFGWRVREGASRAKHCHSCPLPTPPPQAGEGAGPHVWRVRMKITADSPPVLTALDRPNSYIGRSVPRPNLERLTQGRGNYVSDTVLPRMAHVAYVRSPHAHARIVSIDGAAAKKAPGVIAVVTGAELAKVITPWVGVLTHLKGIKSAPQHAIAVERACWQGEAVCAIVAKTRAQAEDAVELVDV